jgi:hypothetical protein
MRALAMETDFNEMVRMPQIEKAGRLCTAPWAPVHSYPINLRDGKMRSGEWGVGSGEWGAEARGCDFAASGFSCCLLAIELPIRF